MFGMNDKRDLPRRVLCMQVTVHVPYIAIFGTSTQKDRADDPRQVTGYLINS